MVLERWVAKRRPDDMCVEQADAVSKREAGAAGEDDSALTQVVKKKHEAFGVNIRKGDYVGVGMCCNIDFYGVLEVG